MNILLYERYLPKAIQRELKQELIKLLLFESSQDEKEPGLLC